MSFEWPFALLALALVPVAVLGYLLYERTRTAHVSRFASPALFPNLVPRSPRWRRHAPAAVHLVALAVLLVALARPHAALSFPREEATIVLALDVSRSMAAADVEPTRLGAAQAAARRFLDRVPDSYRIGVVTFATRAQVISPATADRGVTEAALRSIRLGEGTALGEAIELSLRLARSVAGEETRRPPPAAILLLSDGAQTQGDRTPAQAARLARRARIPIYAVAVGTPSGVVERPIPGGYRERIRVPPDPETLQRVAATSGGEFFSAGDDDRLRRVYEDLGTRLGRKTERTEITAAFAAAGIVLLLVAGTLSALWFRRLP